MAINGNSINIRFQWSSVSLLTCQSVAKETIRGSIRESDFVVYDTTFALYGYDFELVAKLSPFKSTLINPEVRIFRDKRIKVVWINKNDVNGWLIFYSFVMDPNYDLCSVNESKVSFRCINKHLHPLAEIQTGDGFNIQLDCHFRCQTIKASWLFDRS